MIDKVNISDNLNIVFKKATKKETKEKKKLSLEKKDDKQDT